MDNRKNTILLTVIAVATLLVAVVGATFAYFTAQGGNEKETSVSVTTSTTNSAAFNIDSAIDIKANQSNFVKDGIDASGSTEAYAKFQAGNDASADFCYNVSLIITANNFEKCNEDENGCAKDSTVTDPKDAAELVFTATKSEGVEDAGTKKVSAKEGTSTALINAQDVTKVVVGDEIKVPNTVGSTTEFEHKISVAAGVEKIDHWKFDVSFVNLNHDQQYNSGKQFGGTIKFTKVECAK